MLDDWAIDRTVPGVSDFSAIAGVDSRIAAIRARIGALTSTSSSSGTSSSTELGEPSNPTDGFDPFGAVYQLALESAGVGAPVSGFSSGASSGTEAYTGRSSSSPVSSSSSSSRGAVRVATSASYGPAPAYVGGVLGSTGGGTGLSVGQVGGYGSMPVPSELQVYGNGQIPAAALVPIGQGGHRLYAPAAEQWQRLVADAAQDGVTMKVTDSYRSYADQVDLVDRKGLYKNGGYGATPGTSNHGWGLAVDADVSEPAAMAWIKANGYKYGFVEAVPREPWHWEYRPNQA